MMYALITGSTGLIGSSIYKNFLYQNYDKIFCLTRKKTKQANEKTFFYNYQDLENFSRDVLSKDISKNIIFDIFLFSGETIFGFINQKKWQRIYDSRVTVNKNVINLLSKFSFPVRKIFSASAIGVYYGNDHNQVDEDSSISSNLVSDLIKEWESTLLDSVFRNVSVLMRFGAVLSKNSKISQSLFLPSLFSIGFSFTENYYFPWIFLDEIHFIIKFLIEKDFSGVVNVVSPEYITYEDFVEKFVQYKSLFKKAFLIKIPSKIFEKSLKFFMKDYYEMIYSLFRSPKVIPKRLLDLGYNYSFPSLQNILDKI